MTPQLPQDVIRYIYTFDPTFHIVFTDYVLHQLNYNIKYIEINTLYKYDSIKYPFHIMMLQRNREKLLL